MAKAKSEEGIMELVKTVFWALIIAGVFRTLFFQPFWIPSSSMKETLLVGDFLMVNKMAYGYSKYSCPFSMCPITGRIFGSDPERGDVAVFRHPLKGDDLIKRVIGLPGDTVQVKSGVLYLNGEMVPQEPAGIFEEVMEPQGPMGYRPKCENGIVGDGGICQKSRFIETLPGGRQHTVLNIVNAAGMPDNTGVYTVPEGHYFVMGDNRDDSADSRYSRNTGDVGFVPAENLIGRADRIIFSSAGKRILYFWTWRSDRFFVPVQ
ncbi:signal peptidase I [Xinfangfangia sp. CPCC 101601]|uniref:Signal peptidase I n=1 Tax=Pseudogemmobacter lacusdianii TaxID=3069608 RepID=A0ABU0VXE0_9RHOB|nr:signal peptidase I [Xinfangfangia sp. CPCC 101601]MDQ2066424.1 signal peptidase I [Xinfangfangia sp. CPCC 101601]